MTALLLPHSELVLKAWLGGITGLPNAAAELPQDTSSWASTGFVTYVGLGGVPFLDLPVRRPMFQIDTWAVPTNPTSTKPPWGMANQLAELIVAATYAPASSWGIRGVDLGSSYRKARVMGATVISEPRRFFADSGAAARYTMTLQLTWSEVPA